MLTSKDHSVLFYVPFFGSMLVCSTTGSGSVVYSVVSMLSINKKEWIKMPGPTVLRWPVRAKSHQFPYISSQLVCSVNRVSSFPVCATKRTS